MADRAGLETKLPLDPGAAPGDAHLVFIGHVRSPWGPDNPPPRNPTMARERGGEAALKGPGGASLDIDPPYRAALAGLEHHSHIFVLAWLHLARRDLAVITPPRADGPRGVFSIRSPVRPNPIGLSVARILSIDAAAGMIAIDAIDFLDATPLIDIKPYRPGIDAIPDAVVP